jgi:hypothetical protein
MRGPSQLGKDILRTIVTKTCATSIQRLGCVKLKRRIAWPNCSKSPCFGSVSSLPKQLESELIAATGGDALTRGRPCAGASRTLPWAPAAKTRQRASSWSAPPCRFDRLALAGKSFDVRDSSNDDRSRDGTVRPYRVRTRYLRNAGRPRLSQS